MELRKALSERLQKAKYIKRWKDKSGKYRYLYGNEKTKAFDKVLTAAKKTPLHDIPDVMLKKIATIVKKNKATVDAAFLQGFTGDKRRGELLHALLQLKGFIPKAVASKNKENSKSNAAMMQQKANELAGYEDEDVSILQEAPDVWVSEEPTVLGWFSPNKQSLISVVGDLHIKRYGRTNRAAIEKEIFKDRGVYRYTGGK